jgi:hypothetical protein
MRRRLARRNYPNNLYPILIPNSMRNNQHGDTPDEPHRQPSFLTLFEGILDGQLVFIAENQTRSFEADSVLSQIRSAFVWIPFKAHAEAPPA